MKPRRVYLFAVLLRVSRLLGANQAVTTILGHSIPDLPHALEEKGPVGEMKG